MVAYSDFIADARIRSYINILNSNGVSVDMIILHHPFFDKHSYPGMDNRYYCVSHKYQGNNVFVYMLSYLKFFILASYKLAVLYRQNKYKLIHFHNMPNFIVFSGIVPKLYGTKCILDIHDLMIPIYTLKFDGRWKNVIKIILKIEQKISVDFVDRIICADHLQKETLMDEFHVNEDKITVILNLPHGDIFKKVEVPRASDRFNLVYHGTVAKRLGIDLLLRAIQCVKNEIPVKLHIIGLGDYFEEIKKLRVELNLLEEVYLSGNVVPPEQLSEILCGMDAGIIGNRNTMATNRYMMPVKLFEYAYLGLPIIAPRLDIIKYYFDESMVMYYEPENIKELSLCIVELYKNPEKRKSLVDHAATFFSKYNNENKASSYMALIKKLTVQ